MNDPIVYVKNNQEVQVSVKFIYSCDIYKIWSKGACLLDQTYYATINPLKIKTPNVLKKSGYVIRRFINLESAPEEYLIRKGYKLKNL